MQPFKKYLKLMIAYKTIYNFKSFAQEIRFIIFAYRLDLISKFFWNFSLKHNIKNAELTSYINDTQENTYFHNYRPQEESHYQLLGGKMLIFSQKTPFFNVYYILPLKVFFLLILLQKLQKYVQYKSFCQVDS